MEVENTNITTNSWGRYCKTFTTHHNTLDIPLYLRIANELYLKRLIVGGKKGVFEFAKDFRTRSIEPTTWTTMLEFYVAYKDYNWMMGFVEKMLEQTRRCLRANKDRIWWKQNRI